VLVLRGDHRLLQSGAIVLVDQVEHKAQRKAPIWDWQVSGDSLQVNDTLLAMVGQSRAQWRFPLRFMLWIDSAVNKKSSCS
jgi:hypothetical protein